MRLDLGYARSLQSRLLWASIAVASVPAGLAAQQPLYGETILSSADGTESSFASAVLEAPAGPDDMAALMKRLEETEKRLNKMDESAKKKKADDEKKKAEDAKKPKKWYETTSLRGYAQFRYNYVTHEEDPGARPQYVGDGSIGDNQEFLIRRARIIWTCKPNDHVQLYLQPDFASTPDGAVNNIQFAQIRDWYGDLYIDKEQVHRFRVGQSKVPYGWENLQSSSNRLCLDRNDAFNSSVRNERDLGVFYYWTPEYATELFKKIMDENLKGSGNYGVFGIGVYNGQGGSLRELNDELHLVARLAVPWENEDGQIQEIGIQGYTGRYVVTGASIRRPNGTNGIPLGATGNNPGQGQLDQRIGATYVYYPQPIGFQTEWMVGRGAALNADFTALEQRAVYGGYAQLFAKIDTQCHGELFPFVRYSQYKGGYKNQTNSPYSHIHETSLGLEWQFNKGVELVTEYLITDRTSMATLNGTAAGSPIGYNQFDGEVLRFQLQCNF